MVVQALINMSVVLGMVPTKGIPLPMISYGGSSLLSTLALLGILMNVRSMRDRARCAVSLWQRTCGRCGQGWHWRFLMAGGGTGGM